MVYQTIDIICETKKHGKAGSVDQEAVVAEQVRVWKILAQYTPRDWFNLDEMALLPFAVPDHGLATILISGKKVNKFQITLAFLCNANGSQKFLIFYIGRARHPMAFNQQDPNQAGFHYSHNKMAWMTSEFFDKWDSICIVWLLLISPEGTSENLTSRCTCKIGRLFCLSTISVVTTLNTVQLASDWSFSHQIWLPLSNHLTLGSSAVSKLTIVPCSVNVPWILIQLERITYLRLTFARPC